MYFACRSAVTARRAAAPSASPLISRCQNAAAGGEMTWQGYPIMGRIQRSDEAEIHAPAPLPPSLHCPELHMYKKLLHHRMQQLFMLI